MSRESRRHGDREERRTARQESAADEARGAGESARTSPAQYLREVRGELRKVAWPSRKEVVSYTIVVLVTTTVLVGIVYAMDFVIREAVINTLGG
jgi:preprotein translocase subunit SecE